MRVTCVCGHQPGRPFEEVFRRHSGLTQDGVLPLLYGDVPPRGILGQVLSFHLPCHAPVALACGLRSRLGTGLLMQIGLNPSRLPLPVCLPCFSSSAYSTPSCSFLCLSPTCFSAADYSPARRGPTSFLAVRLCCLSCKQRLRLSGRGAML